MKQPHQNVQFSQASKVSEITHVLRNISVSEDGHPCMHVGFKIISQLFSGNLSAIATATSLFSVISWVPLITRKR